PDLAHIRQTRLTRFFDRVPPIVNSNRPRQSSHPSTRVSPHQASRSVTVTLSSAQSGRSHSPPSSAVSPLPRSPRPPPSVVVAPSARRCRLLPTMPSSFYVPILVAGMIITVRSFPPSSAPSLTLILTLSSALGLK
ncbi:hypothetical protein EIP91_001327, partial [Steccherinum ochraceum]